MNDAPVGDAQATDLQNLQSTLDRTRNALSRISTEHSFLKLDYDNLLNVVNNQNITIQALRAELANSQSEDKDATPENRQGNGVEDRTAGIDANPVTEEDVAVDDTEALNEQA